MITSDIVSDLTFTTGPRSVLNAARPVRRRNAARPPIAGVDDRGRGTMAGVARPTSRLGARRGVQGRDGQMPVSAMQ